jgi:hypothetical protein
MTHPNTPHSFFAGINIEGDDVRGFSEKIVKILKSTPINWIRIHHLRNRSLEEKNQDGITYLDGIEYLCKNGYNILAPIEVGYKKNVGNVDFDSLDKFVDEAYEQSYESSKKISKIVEKYNTQIMFGIENEIDQKAWILQAIPGIAWRANLETWVKQSIDYKLKYKRLNNIRRGILDANPSAKIMTNIVAEDIRVFFHDFYNEIKKITTLLGHDSDHIEKAYDNMIDWKTELKYIKKELEVDYIGLDNYANWIMKYPIYGEEIGGKVFEALELSGKPIINAEFGYTTYRTFVGKFVFNLCQRPSASDMQLEFFQKSLQSIEDSPSIGTFPWVLLSHPHIRAVPQQESYFGLIKMNPKDQLKREPAFDYYIKWLKRKIKNH